MGRDITLQIRKENDIKAEIKNLLGNGIALQCVLEQVAYKFYLTVTTVERIHWGGYDRKRQIQAERAEHAQLGLPPPPRSNAKQPAPPKEPKRRGRPPRVSCAAS